MAVSVSASILDHYIFNEVRCLSTDTKPMDGIKNGSHLVEIDTGYEYLYDRANRRWCKQPKESLQKTFRLTYMSQDGLTVLYEEDVIEGADGVWAGTPTKEQDYEYAYTFDGWSTSANQEEATEHATERLYDNRTVYAAFSKTNVLYSVIWYRAGNNSWYYSWNRIPYGTTMQMSSPSGNPQKESDAQYDYTFAGWTSDISQSGVDGTVDHALDDEWDLVEPYVELVDTSIHPSPDIYGAVKIYPVYTKTLRTFTVKFYSGLSQDQLTYYWSETAQYGEDLPYRAGPAMASDEQYHYDFEGYTRDIQSAGLNGVVDNNALNNITEDTDIYTVYTRRLRYYTITWNDDDNRTLGVESLAYGSVPSHTLPTHQSTGNQATQWNPTPYAVNANQTYTAVYPTWTVRYMNGSTALQTFSDVADGAATPAYTGSTPQHPTDPSGYEFTGWSPSVAANVSADTDYVAQFEQAGPGEISDSWDQIIAAVNDGTYTKYNVGDYKPLNLGTEGTVNMQLAAKDADDLASGNGKAEMTFVAMECLATTRAMNSTATNMGSWDSSEMKTYLENTVLPLVPSNVAAKIRPVKKYSYSYSPSTTDQESSCKLWIPSRREVNDGGGQETQGPVYSDIFIDSASRARTRSGSASTWWLRSAMSNNNIGFYYVNSDSNINGESALVSRSVVLGFCLSARDDVNVSEIQDSWDTIISKIANGTANYKLGNYKPLDLGTEGIVNMQIVGSGANASSLADNTGNATYDWVSMELLNTSHNMNVSSTTSGGWTASSMRSYLTNTIKPLIPANVRGALKAITKYSYYEETGGVSEDHASTDELWIPSYHEVFDDSTYETHGPTYTAVFDSAASRVKHKADSSSAHAWWLRSAESGSSFRYVSTGGYAYSNIANNVSGVALGFSL